MDGFYERGDFPPSQVADASSARYFEARLKGSADPTVSRPTVG